MHLDESDQEYCQSHLNQSLMRSCQVIGKLDGKFVYRLRSSYPAFSSFQFDDRVCSQLLNMHQSPYAKVRTWQQVEARRLSTKPPNFVIKQEDNDSYSRKSRLKYHSLDKSFNFKKNYKEQYNQQYQSAHIHLKRQPVKRNKGYIRKKNLRRDKRRLKIQVVETKIGVVLDLRQLRESRLNILKNRQSKKNDGTIQKRQSKCLNLTPTNFPSLLVLKNHKLASQSVKIFMKQLSQKYQDSLEIIRQDRQKKLIWCAPPPPDEESLPNLSSWLYQNDELISLSDSETFVDQEDWLMDIESHHDYAESSYYSCNDNLFFDNENNQHQQYLDQNNFAQNQVICVQNVQNFSNLIGFDSCCGKFEIDDDFNEYIDL